MSNKQSSFLIVGGTGLVGSHLIRELSESQTGTQISSFVRRPLGEPLSGVSEFVIDFEQLAALTAESKAKAAFCCLGTTIAKAGSQKAFEKVDHHLPLEFARGALEGGAKQFHVVTALGADARSAVFYNRVKGKLEIELIDMGFESLHIYRPSLLLGARNERRPGEYVAKKLAPFLNPMMIGPLKQYRAISGRDVARCIRIAAEKAPTGLHIYPSKRIQDIADSGIWRS